MTDVLLQYGLFLAQAVTVVAAIGAVVLIILMATKKDHGSETFEVKNLNDKYEAMEQMLRSAVLPKDVFKKALKAEKAKRKAKQKENKKKIHDEATQRRRLFVLDFHGDIKASAIGSLREEITAVLKVAREHDEIVVRLENAGGLVHDHGLAASQLLRIKDRKIPLSVVVDKVAASGGYMMACVADRIVAAPFAVIGSIGVLAQLPNFNRLLDKHGIDFEQIKAGDFKRTVTMFGKNTNEDRQKLQDDLEDTHALFKDFVSEHRGQLDIAKVATGEHWYGSRALDLKLVDELMTSDDYLLRASEEADLYEVSYKAKKTLSDRILSSMQAVFRSARMPFGGHGDGVTI